MKTTEQTSYQLVVFIKDYRTQYYFYDQYYKSF